MIAWINFAILIFATLLFLYYYVLSVSPATREKILGPDAYTRCGQDRAIAIGFEVISHSAGAATPLSGNLSLYVALAMALFAILFGTRNMDASEHHRGLMWAIAFESVVKLLAFLSIGMFVIFGVFDGFANVAQRI